jgi:membrane-associated phospholipid phosphatase
MADSDAQKTSKPQKAGAFDIRNFIGALIGIYGIILVLTSFFDSGKALTKADGIRINLWAGLFMLLLAGFFLVWARLRPVIVDETHETQTPDGRPAEH